MLPLVKICYPSTDLFVRGWKCYLLSRYAILCSQAPYGYKPWACVLWVAFDSAVASSTWPDSARADSLDTIKLASGLRYRRGSRTYQGVRGQLLAL